MNTVRSPVLQSKALVERKQVNLVLQVFQLLKDTCAAILQACTSLEQDEQILRQSAADACMVAAVSWRMSYKR